MAMNRGGSGRALRTAFQRNMPRFRGGRESEVDRQIRKNEERILLEKESRDLYPESGKRDIEDLE